MRMRWGVMVGATVGLLAGVALFMVFPQAPIVDTPVALEIAPASTQGDGGLTGNPVEAVASTEQFGWSDAAQPPADTDAQVGGQAAPAPVQPDVATEETLVLPPQQAVPEPVVVDATPSLEEAVAPQDAPQETAAAPAPTQPVLAEPPAAVAPGVAASAPAGDPMLEAFARVSLITFDLADAYGPAIEAAKATGTEGALREELARETKIAIEEEFAWGFDAYVTFAQEVRRNPALEADVARVMASLRP
jgi:hypothetical protein